MLTIFLQEVEVNGAQFWAGAAIIGGILLLSYLITKYTKYGGGSNYGGADGFDDDIDIY